MHSPSIGDFRRHGGWHRLFLSSAARRQLMLRAVLQRATAQHQPGLLPAEQSIMCPHPHTPSHRTSPRSHSPHRTSTGWGCSAHSRTGTGSIGSSSGPPSGFLATRGECRKSWRYLTTVFGTAEVWEHLRPGYGWSRERHPVCSPRQHRQGPFSSSPASPLLTALSKPIATTVTAARWVLRGQTPPMI